MKIRQSPKLPAKVRRGQLLESALSLFLKKGYQATTTEAIARHAGVSKGSLYFHFSSKEDLLCELARAMIDSFSEALKAVKGKRMTPVDMFRFMGRIDQEMPHPEARNNLSLLSEAIKVPRIRRMVDEMWTLMVSNLASCLDPAYARTAARRRQIVIMIGAIYDGLQLARYFHPDEIDFDLQARTMAAVFKPVSNSKR